MFAHDPQKVYVFQGSCFLDVIWYEAVKEVHGEDEGSEGEEEGSDWYKAVKEVLGVEEGSEGEKERSE